MAKAAIKKSPIHKKSNVLREGRSAPVSEQQKRRAQIVARLAVHWFSTLRPEDYGAVNVSGAMDRVMVLHAVRKCESDGVMCTAARLQKELRIIPDSNVRRALGGLEAMGAITRLGRRYISSLDGDGLYAKRIDNVVETLVAAVRELVELEGARLLITKGGES